MRRAASDQAQSLGMPEYVEDLPKIRERDRVQPDLLEKGFRGYLVPYCSRCRNGQHQQLFAEKWTVWRGCGTTVAVLMRCPSCGGVAVLQFLAMLEVGTGNCVHTPARAQYSLGR